MINADLPAFSKSDLCCQDRAYPYRSELALFSDQK
jgi:hypothetical protein